MKKRIRHRVLVRHFVAPEFIDWFNALSGREQLHVLLTGDMLRNAAPEMPEEPESDELLKVYLNTYIPEKGALFRSSELIDALMKNSPDASVKLELAFYAYHALIFSQRPGAKFNLARSETEKRPIIREETSEEINEFSRFSARTHEAKHEAPETPVEQVAHEEIKPDETPAPEVQVVPEEKQGKTTSNIKQQLTGMFD